MGGTQAPVAGSAPGQTAGARHSSISWGRFSTCQAKWQVTNLPHKGAPCTPRPCSGRIVIMRRVFVVASVAGAAALAGLCLLLRPGPSPAVAKDAAPAGETVQPA